MKKSVAKIINLANQFERKLISLGKDNPNSSEILALQKAITDCLNRVPEAKLKVNTDLRSLPKIGTSSPGNVEWTPGPLPNDEDSYLGERTKRAVYILNNLSDGVIPNVGTTDVSNIANIINNWKPNASYQPKQQNRSQ